MTSRPEQLWRQAVKRRTGSEPRYETWDSLPDLNKRVFEEMAEKENEDAMAED